MSKIPFSAWPGHWGLVGKTREKAKAEYELSGYELERKLLEIDGHTWEPMTAFAVMLDHKHLKISDYDRDMALLELREFTTEKAYKEAVAAANFKHGKIDKEQMLRELAGLIDDKTQAELALLSIDHDYKKITDLEYEKKVATINGLPWVNVVNMDFTKNTSLEGSFELDWNEFFVNKLKDEGYSGLSDDVIVNQWFVELCKNIALEEFDGVGNFSRDAEANVQALKRWTSESIEDGKKKAYK